ncbi:MAG: hypothetical protein ABH875_05630 [Candidatus Omnitrophota bacterium]
MEKEKAIDVYEMIGFVLRHPWILVSSVVIIMSTVSAQVDYMDLLYEAEGLISFEGASEEETYSKRDLSANEIKANAIMQRTLVSGNVEKIMTKVWPDVTESGDPERYDRLHKRLRGQNGIKMNYNKRSDILEISYRDTDPNICRKVVEATISALEEENKTAVRKKIETGLGFLREQGRYYKKIINDIESKIAAIITVLKEKANSVGKKERLLISEITDGVNTSLLEQGAMLKMAQYEEKTFELNMQLLEAEKKKENLEEMLASGEFPATIKTEQDHRGDTYVEEYSKMIAEKQLGITNLRAQGYLAAHPEIAKLKKVIEALKDLIENRAQELEGESLIRLSDMAGMAGKEAAAEVKVQIRQTELEIDTLKDKIDMLNEQYREQTQAADIAETPEMREISAQAARINELRKELEINNGYYDNIRKQTEEKELKSRMEEAEAGVNIVVIERPRVPTDPLPFQRQQRLLIGLVFSVFIGISIAYVIESLDNSIRSASELRELLRAPVLGSIDRISTLREHAAKSFRRRAIMLFLAGFFIFSRIFGRFLF